MSDTKANHSESIQNLEAAAIVSNNVDSIESNNEPEAEEPVAEEPVVEEPEAEEPVVEEPVVEEPVVEEPEAEEPVVEEPVVEEPDVEEPEAEEPVVEEPVVEEPVLEESSVKSDNLCSLKTLINVLGKWSNKEIRRGNVETLLKEGTEVDENLDNIEKALEVLKLWIKEGGTAFKSHDHFLDMEGYTLIDESKNLSEEKKVEVLKTLTELVINVSNGRLSNEEIDNVLKNL